MSMCCMCRSLVKDRHAVRASAVFNSYLNLQSNSLLLRKFCNVWNRTCTADGSVCSQEQKKG